MKFERDQHLHSREHLLADDLARTMGELRRFAAYLGVAKMYHESDLRALAKRVAATRDVEPKNRGKYFFAALRGLAKKIVWLPSPARTSPRPRAARRGVMSRRMPSVKISGRTHAARTPVSKTGPS